MNWPESQTRNGRHKKNFSNKFADQSCVPPRTKIKHRVTAHRSGSRLVADRQAQLPCPTAHLVFAHVVCFWWTRTLSKSRVEPVSSETWIFRSAKNRKKRTYGQNELSSRWFQSSLPSNKKKQNVKKTCVQKFVTYSDPFVKSNESWFAVNGAHALPRGRWAVLTAKRCTSCLEEVMVKKCVWKYQASSYLWSNCKRVLTNHIGFVIVDDTIPAAAAEQMWTGGASGVVKFSLQKFFTVE